MTFFSIFKRTWHGSLPDTKHSVGLFYTYKFGFDMARPLFLFFSLPTRPNSKFVHQLIPNFLYVVLQWAGGYSSRWGEREKKKVGVILGVIRFAHVRAVERQIISYRRFLYRNIQLRPKKIRKTTISFVDVVYTRTS